MFIGVGNPIPRIANLPGASRPGGGGGGGGGGLAQVDNLYSFEFDGADSIMDLGADVLFDSTGGFSFSAWVYLDAFSNFYPGVINLITDQATSFLIMVSNAGAYAGVNFGSSNNFARARTNGDISGDFITTWKHICVTFDGVDRADSSSYKIYVDGVSATLTTTGAFGASSNTANTIAWSGISNFYWNGKIDEVGIFNAALTSSEVQSIYNATTTGKTADLSALSTPPIAWYRMGD